MRVDQQRWLEAEVERLGPLEALVRALAASDQVVNLGGDRFDDWVCMACPEEWELPYIEQESDLTHHEACPWVLAKRWVEANPEERRG